MEKGIFEIMQEKHLNTKNGKVCYWVSRVNNNQINLVFLHGLTADHTLFEKQISHYLYHVNLLCWDAPAHGQSRPYGEFSYANAVADLKAILKMEGISQAIFIGQSMGGYVIQSLIKHDPHIVKGFVGIDTCPFGEQYYSEIDKWWLRQMEWMCRCFPRNLLVNAIAKNCSYTKATYDNMRSALASYTKEELCYILGAGYSDFLRENCDLSIQCPVLIIVGEHDQTGKVKQYCLAWHQVTNNPLAIIPNAAHNSNFDNPIAVNGEIDAFINNVICKNSQK